MEIGFFQFDNLVRSRIPFKLICFQDFDFQDYQSLEKKHLDSVLIKIDPKLADDQILELKLPLNAPIVLLCEDGKKSKALFEKLEKKGFLNLYYIFGGYQQLIKKDE